MNNLRFFIMRSETQAIKAKKLLQANSIAASVNKISSKDGCSFGVAFPEIYYENVVILLNRNDIPFAIASPHK